MDVLIVVMFVIIVIMCAIFVISSINYNKFQDVIIRINEVEANIDSNLRSKYDMINRAVAIIKGNIEMDKDLFGDMVKLRSRKIGNFELDRKLTDANMQFMAIKDEHPELNDSEEIKKISKQIQEVDDKLETFRSYYDDNITKYNKLVRSFPSNIIAMVCKYQEKMFFDRKDMSDDDYEDFKL